jgi:hypothetical protein
LCRARSPGSHNFVPSPHYSLFVTSIFILVHTYTTESLIRGQALPFLSIFRSCYTITIPHLVSSLWYGAHRNCRVSSTLGRRPLECELYGTEPQTAMRILPMDGVSPQLCDFSPIPTWESANVKRYKMTKQQTNYRLGSRCELRCAQVIT